MNTYSQNTRKFWELLFPFLPAFLLTLASLISEYNARPIVIFSPIQLLRPLLVLWIILVFLIWPLYKIIHDIDGAGLALLVFTMAFYLEENFFYATSSILLITIGLWVGILLILKRKVKVRSVLSLSTFVISILLVLSTALVIPNFLSVDWNLYRSSLPRQTDALPLSQSNPQDYPDIYYIILDGYGRSDILKKYYQYDNSEFINDLVQKGFTVPSGIYSNYAKTSVSVPSTLNLDYIQDLVPGIEDSLFWWAVNPFIHSSIVQLSLEQAGYKTVSIATDWDITNLTNSDIHFSPKRITLNEFEAALLAKTQLQVFRPLLSKFAFVPTISSHHQLVLYNFETLAKIPEIPGPKFIFAHIVVPHPPFVFDKNGNLTQPGYSFSFNDGNDFPGSKEEYKTGYVDQVEFVNGKLQGVIDAILAKSSTPPIIILQADHGPGMLTDFTSSENTCLEERFSIFAAYYLPGLEDTPIPEDITPVNTFRIIFNEYFSTDLPMLENRSYYYEDTIYIYRVEDVTKQLHDNIESNACYFVP